MTTSKLPKNVVVRDIIVTDLSQQLKKQRDFLKWMSRRYKETNIEQSEAFATGARLFDELRVDLAGGLFNAGEVEELFTEESPAASTNPSELTEDEILELGAQIQRARELKAAAPELIQVSLQPEVRGLLASIAAGNTMVADDLAARALEVGLQQLKGEADRRQANIDRLEKRRQNAGKPGYTASGDKKCGDAFCDYAADNHPNYHSND